MWRQPTALLWLQCFICSLALPALGKGDTPRTGVLEISQSENPASVVDTKTVIRKRLPDTLFGFNIQHFNFENDLWLEARRMPDPGVTEALAFFPGALYRYPGGLVANRFWWHEAVGPPDMRQPQKIVKWDQPRPVLFGVNEYLEFVHAVDGQPFYVLNLVGWDEQQMFRELPADQMNKSNAALAEFILEHIPDKNAPRYYQLGNELGRADYQWSHEKYVERARGTIESIRKVDPDAQFVAFLRDFEWRYRDNEQEGSFSRYQDFITDVLEGLPSVDDFSLQFYYDDPGLDRRLKQIPERLRQFRDAIDIATRANQGKVPGVWITEHARGINLGAGNVMRRARVTSNLAAAVSTGDFLTALAQMPEIRGAAWHGLNAGPWQLFDATIEYKDLRPRPVYWAMRVLRALELPVVLSTRTASPNVSQYAGGYDIRTAAFASESGDRLGLWAVNRAPRVAELQLEVASWKNRSVDVRHFYLRGEPGVDPDDPEIEIDIELEPDSEPAKFSASGTLVLRLPPSSVSSFLILPAPNGQGVTH